MISLLKKMLLAMLPLTIILLIWQAAALTVLLVRGVAFPTPWETLVRLVNLAGGDRLSYHSLWVHIVSSLQRWMIGFGIAAILGIAYGLMAGRVSWFEKATAKIPQMLLLVPGLAWIPVAILMFGIGESATVFMIAVSAFAPVAINVLAGIKNIDIGLIRAAEMMGAGKNALFLRALKAAGGYAAEHPQETVTIMAGETGLSAATTRQAMKRHDYRLRLDGEILDSLRKTALFLKDRGIIDHLPDFGRAVDGRLLE